MSRMMWVMALGACVMLAGCAAPHCGRFGYGRASGRCDDCTPPWVPYLGHYKQRLDDKVTRMTALKCAWRGLDSYRGRCGGAVSGDFAAGFERAYIDLAENRTPQPSAVPPSKYWSAYYRSCAGRPHVDDWYAGYYAGLEMGSQSGVSRFNQIDLRGCGIGAGQGGGMMAYDSHASYSSGSVVMTSGGLGCACRSR